MNQNLNLSRAARAIGFVLLVLFVAALMFGVVHLFAQAIANADPDHNYNKSPGDIYVFPDGWTPVFAFAYTNQHSASHFMCVSAEGTYQECVPERIDVDNQ